eukprot:scaffold34990_cov66-Phaeocystis_antarctica.AAC.5
MSVVSRACSHCTTPPRYAAAATWMNCLLVMLVAASEAPCAHSAYAWSRKPKALHCFTGGVCFGRIEVGEAAKVLRQRREFVVDRNRANDGGITSYSDAQSRRHQKRAAFQRCPYTTTSADRLPWVEA